MGQQKVGDPEDPSEPVNDGLVWNCVRQNYTNSAAKIFNAAHSEILHCPLDIADEPLLEIFPVAAFEGKLVVVDDRAAHSFSGKG